MARVVSMREIGLDASKTVATLLVPVTRRRYESAFPVRSLARREPVAPLYAPWKPLNNPATAPSMTSDSSPSASWTQSSSASTLPFLPHAQKAAGPR